MKLFECLLYITASYRVGMVRISAVLLLIATRNQDRLEDDGGRLGGRLHLHEVHVLLQRLGMIGAVYDGYLRVPLRTIGPFLRSGRF